MIVAVCACLTLLAIIITLCAFIVSSTTDTHDWCEER